MESLKEKTAKGLFWGGMNNAFQQMVGVIFGIVLGRLLCQEDYGMMAMISIFSLVATALQNSGFAVALTNLKSPTAEDYNAVFWFNVGMGVVMYLILFCCAPLIADYYHQPALVWFMRYAFLSVPAASLGTVQSAYLFKNLRAESQAKAGMVAVLSSSVTGVVMAFYGMAYWSLASQGLIYVSVYTIMVWIYSPWRPSFRGITFAPVRRMFGFSSKVLFTMIATHVNNNVLNILLGRYYSAHQVGVYNQAYQWNFKSSSLVQNMVNQVAQPVLADLRDERTRLLGALRKMVRFTCFVSFPLLLGLALVSHEFICVTITAKWISSVPLLRILCVSGCFLPLSALMSQLLLSKGRSDLYLWCTVSLGVLLILLMWLMRHWGILPMVVGYSVLQVSWFIVWHYFVRRETGYGYVMLLRDVLPFLMVSVSVMALTHLLTVNIIDLWLALLTKVLLAVVLYVGIMRSLGVAIFKESMAFLRQKFGRKRK